MGVFPVQGAALARVGLGWVGGQSEAGKEKAAAPSLEQLPDQGVATLRAAVASGLGGRSHGAVVLGTLGALLRLPAGAVQLALAYTATRDLLSAAVRMNLVGPLAAVAMQSELTEAVAAAAAANSGTTAEAAGAAPLVDALHSCHDMLERRIFQT